MSNTSGHLEKIIGAFGRKGCRHILLKALSPNDNSKNQVYIGGADGLQILPWRRITQVKSASKKIGAKGVIVHAELDFSWLILTGEESHAPRTKIIAYTQYPECRLSGFLLGCKNPPSDLMNSRAAGRYLFLGITPAGSILAHVAIPDSETRVRIDAIAGDSEYGAFRTIPCRNFERPFDSKKKLLGELARIHQMGTVPLRRLNRDGDSIPYVAQNAVGFTLEAFLGIRPNGRSEPDYYGWELKHHSKNRPITLFSPEPDGGLYADDFSTFMTRFGYADKLGRRERTNFGGRHHTLDFNAKTGLILAIKGVNNGDIVDPNASVGLIDQNGFVAASWSILKILKHWNRKHNQAAYIESDRDKSAGECKFGPIVLLGEGTDLKIFLSQLEIGNIYFDPAHKQVNVEIGKPKTKRRNQFRIRQKNLKFLYQNFTTVNLTDNSIIETPETDL